MSFEVAIQTAIFQQLIADPALIAREIPIYDDVPQANDSGEPSVFPYIVVGEDSLVNWDTDTELGGRASITIHTWSRYAGKLEVKQIQANVYDALHNAELTIPGHACVMCSFAQSDSFLDVDGKTRHGVSIFDMLIEKL